MRLVLATANPHKVAEIRALLRDRVELLPRPPEVPDVVEDSGTIEGNARLKACALAEATGLPALADDTGLEIDALGGLPGVDTAYFAGPQADAAANVARTLAELDGVAWEKRGARFVTVALVAWPDGRDLVATGEVRGRIALSVSGGSGFGYDPIFVPDEGDGRTFAEMGDEAKHAISHRSRAMRAIADLLDGLEG
jgi:XTP/dITP diphosphohydrolase